VARSMGHPWGVAQVVRQLGVLAYRQGDLDRASALLEASLVRWAKLRATRGAHWSLSILGHVALTRNDPWRAAAYFAESLALCREAGDRHGMAQCLDGLAAAALAADAAAATWSVRAARLLGLAAALREQVGTSLGPFDRQTFEQAVAAVRASLGEEAYASARAEGRAMSRDQGIEDGLELARQIQAAAAGLAPDSAPPLP
jgi:Tetratricopeptide repeat